MKAEEFCELLSDANETYVNHARAVSQSVKRPHWIPWVAVAACLCLAVGAVLYWSAPRDPVAENPAPSPTNSAGIAPITPWEEREIYEQYYYLEYNGFQYDSNELLSSELVGNKLAQADAWGWEYVSGAEEIKHTKDATIYSIKDISTECAVAIQYEDTEEFYVFTNVSYRPETLGQFISDLNLKETLFFGNVFYSGDRASFRFEGVDPAVVWELLLSEPDAMEVYNEFELHLLPRDIMGISIDLPLFGYKNISLSVCEDGHILTNILGTGKLFYIGEEKTEAFIDYVWNNCTVYETPYDSGGSSSALDPVPSFSIRQDGASSPSYHP